MKLGIIRCEETAKRCGGWNCFPSIRDLTGNFSVYDGIDLVGFLTCGGCGQGKTDKVLEKAKYLKQHGAEVIHLGNCLASGCPYRRKYAGALRKAGYNIVERTHPSATPEQQAHFREIMKARKKEAARKKAFLIANGFTVEEDERF